MKKFSRQLASFVLLCLPFMLSVIYMYDLFIYRKKDEYIKYFSYDGQKNIVLGSSHSMEITPSSFFNFGSGSQTLDTSEMILLDIIKRNSLENVILVISPFSFHTNQENYSDIINNFPQTYDPIVLRFFKDNLKLTILFELIKRKLLGKSDSFEIPKTKSAFTLRAQKSSHHLIQNSNNLGYQYFENIRAICRLNQINLKILIAPYTQEYLEFINQTSQWQSDRKKLFQLSENKEITFFDFQNLFNNKPNKYDFFLNPDHINSKGGKVVVSILDAEIH